MQSTFKMRQLLIISLLTWITTSFLCGVTAGTLFSFYNDINLFIAIPAACIVSAVAAFPAFVILLAVFHFIKRAAIDVNVKWKLLILVLLIACLPYGFVLTIILNELHINLPGVLSVFLMVTGALWVLNLFSVTINNHRISRWLVRGTRISLKSISYKSIKSTFKMTNDSNAGYDSPVQQAEDKTVRADNRILIKGSITACLILAMLIPASYTSKLVDEREERHLEVVKEVSDKWASPQTITTPYLRIPYLKHIVNDLGKTVLLRSELFIPAKSLEVNAAMQPEIRKRSIYEVLLYRSTINIKGSVIIDSGSGINAADLLLNEAMLCTGISDLQGIEEKLTARFGKDSYDMQPWLPPHALNASGVSVPVRLTAEDLDKSIPFSLTIKLKGSEKLHFLPLSEESTISINSSWSNPSFDGNVLPDQRDITASGFTAKWRFNKTNMPLVNKLGKANESEEKLAFGVSMIQPSDQYAKTNRSVKYAILFIGLSFAMFFITELVQSRRVHPVQYVLIGLALVIFYTLLLSIGEFTGFNIAYGIATLATVGLVGLYAIQLFKSIPIGSLLGCFLGMLYGYIYILIQLEDTALLAGSIGLFVLLGVAMHFSRKVKWYPANPGVETVI
jgi:inner membrane protein